MDGLVLRSFCHFQCYLGGDVGRETSQNSSCTGHQNFCGGDSGKALILPCNSGAFQKLGISGAPVQNAKMASCEEGKLAIRNVILSSALLWKP